MELAIGHTTSTSFYNNYNTNYKLKIVHVRNNANLK